MSTLIYVKPTAKELLISPMGHKKWKKYQQVKCRTDTGDRARSWESHLEKKDVDGERRGTDKKF